MTKKFFARSDLQHLAATNRPRLNHTTDRLRHALIGHRLLEVGGGCETLALGWWYRVRQFVDDVPPPLGEWVAPLTVFQPNLDRRWSAVMVLYCSAFEVVPKPGEPDVDGILRKLGITYVQMTAKDVDDGYLKTPEFSSRVHRALLATRFLATPQSQRISTTDQERFSDEPRPIYPPRSRYLRD